MSWFNGMVEFLVFWLMGKWWVLGNYDRTNAWLPSYPLGRRIRSSRSSWIFNLALGCSWVPLCLGVLPLLLYC